VTNGRDPIDGRRGGLRFVEAQDRRNGSAIADAPKGKSGAFSKVVKTLDDKFSSISTILVRGSPPEADIGY